MGLFAVTGLLCLGAIAMALLMRSSSTGYRKLREGRVTGIIGRKGHGKTLFAVHEMLRHVGSDQYCRKCSGRLGRKVVHKGVIVSNVKLDLGRENERFFVHIKSLDHLMSLLPTDPADETTGEIPHCSLVLIDEAHLWFPAIAGKSLDDSVASFLAQCRKYAVEVIWIAQREDRAALGLRAQTDEVGICQRGYFRQMVVKFCEPEVVSQLRAKKKDVRPDWTFRYRVTDRVAKAYDTYQLIDVTAASDRAVAGPAPTKEGRPVRPGGRSVPRSITTSEGTRRVS